MDKVAIGRLVLNNREHIIALETMDKGLIGTLLRYPTKSATRPSISTRSRT
jgi:DNA end-binding protein Ku